MKYKVVTSLDLEIVERECTRLLLLGYTPVGGISTSRAINTTKYSQAFILNGVVS